MNLGPTSPLVGLILGPCLQVGRPQGQVPTHPMMDVPAGQWWEDRGAWVDDRATPWMRVGQQAPKGLPLAEGRDLCHSQVPTGSARSAGPGSLRIRGCRQKAPRMLSVVLLFWG